MFLLLVSCGRCVEGNNARLILAKRIDASSMPTHGRHNETGLSSPLVLVVEDDRLIADLLQSVLSINGFRCLSVGTGREAVAAIRASKPSLVLLDVGLPDTTGDKVYRHIRGWYGGPVLVVSGATDESLVVDFLEMGADDYICKPFRPNELVARIRSVLAKRTRAPLPRSLLVADLVIHLDLRRVTRGAADIDLTPMEFDLLVCLVKSLNRIVTIDELQETLWGPHRGDYAQTCRMHIANLRKKLNSPSDPKALIQTAAGVGYYIEDPSGPRSLSTAC